MKITLKFRCLSLLLASLLINCNEVKAASGDPDRTFGSGGVAISNYLNLKLHGIEQQSDGKLLVLAETGVDSSLRIVIRRHNTNGSLDTTFGHQGEAVKSYVPALNLVQRVYGIPYSFKLQSDGKIVVVGVSANSTVGVVWRFTAAGILDTTFGTNGSMVLGSGLNIRASSALDVEISSGKILILYTITRVYSGAGYPFPITRTLSYLTRLLSNGSVDAAFGLLGSVEIPYAFDQPRSGGSRLAVSSARGDIYVFGQSPGNYFPYTPASRVFRYTSGGFSDGSFLPVEIISFDSPCTYDGGSTSSGYSTVFESLIVQSGENIIVGSHSSNIGSVVNIYKNYTSRFLSTGMPDLAYSSYFGGICEAMVVTGDGAPGFVSPYGGSGLVAKQSDGKFIFAGFDSSYPYAKRRFATGAVDTSFQPSTSMGLGSIAGLLIQNADQKIVMLAGPSIGYNGYRLLRLLP